MLAAERPAGGDVAGVLVSPVQLCVPVPAPLLGEHALPVSSPPGATRHRLSLKSRRLRCSAFAPAFESQPDRKQKLRSPGCSEALLSPETFSQPNFPTLRSSMNVVQGAGIWPVIQGFLFYTEDRGKKTTQPQPLDITARSKIVSVVG